MKIRNHSTWIVLLILSLILSSCSALKSLKPVTVSSEPGAILFADDFSITPNGWGTMGRTGGEIGFEYEGLVISVNLPHFMFWTVNADRFRDTRIDVDAVLLEGPANDNFGVICRFQDSENFYGFVISHDGYYGIFKMLDGKLIQTSVDGTLAYSEVIRQGGVVNHLQAVCKGNRLSLSVNDTLLSEVADDSFNEGQIGLLAGAYEYPGVKVLFDNFEVLQP